MQDCHKEKGRYLLDNALLTDLGWQLLHRSGIQSDMVKAGTKSAGREGNRKAVHVSRLAFVPRHTAQNSAGGAYLICMLIQELPPESMTEQRRPNDIAFEARVLCLGKCAENTHFKWDHSTGQGE